MIWEELKGGGESDPCELRVTASDPYSSKFANECFHKSDFAKPRKIDIDDEPFDGKG